MKLPILFVALLVLLSGGIAQTTENHIASRVLYFDQNGLTGQEASQVLVAQPSSPFAFSAQGATEYGGKFYYVYLAVTSTTADIFLVTSPDGINWSTPVQVNDDPGMAFNENQPTISVYGDPASPTICVIWNDERDGTNLAQVRAAISSDGGQTFAASVEISDHNDSIRTYSDLAVDDNGDLYTVWVRWEPGDRLDDTWFSKSTDGGLTWEVPVNIYTERQYSYPPQIVARGNGEILVTIVADQGFKANLVVLHSSNGGSNFALQSPITNYTGSNGNEGPYRTYSLIKDGANLHILYPYVDDGELVRYEYSTSSNFGLNWSGVTTALDTTLTTYQNPVNLRNCVDIAVSEQGILYAVRADKHQDPAQLNYNVYLSRSVDNGQTWEEVMMVNEMPEIEEQTFAQLTVKSSGTSDTVLVVWREQRVVSGIEDDLPGLSQSFELKQNYPNPFNPTTTIAYTLTHAANVSITVYDNTGRQVFLL